MLQDFVERARRNLNLADFASASAPIMVGATTDKPPGDRQYVLRMMLRSDKHALSIPPELEWMRPTINALIWFQEINGLNNPFIYVTVRHGIVDSEKDDEWHADGFSMRFPHVPEQNYVFANTQPTEYVENAWNIPPDFDPLVHNIHTYFQERIPGHEVKTLKEGGVYLMDPYCVHRRPPITKGIMRTFWRISFIPIEIEADSCQQNPLLPVKVYNREDVRTKLIRYV